MRTMARLWSCLALAVAGGALAGCGNPAVDVLVEQLGPEVEGVPEGEFHRPGQPCLLCHGKYGGEEPLMLVAGTVYSGPKMVMRDGEEVPPPPVDLAEILLIDAFGKSPEKTPVTNCVGNFWITQEDWPDVVFPLYAEVRFNLPTDAVGAQKKRAVMGSWIQREGSCNACHQGNASQGSAGRIFCTDQEPNPFQFPENCEGLP